jgi:hypothetical protein
MSRNVLPGGQWLGPALALTLTGCVTAQFAEPISSFEKSLSTSGAAIAVYYTELNRYERDLYLDRLAFNPDETLKFEERVQDDGREQIRATPLIGQIFNADSIRARLDAINLLGVYARRLGELAASDAPQRFEAGAKVLGENLGSLADTFQGLSQREGVPDSSAGEGGRELHVSETPFAQLRSASSSRVSQAMILAFQARASARAASEAPGGADVST